MTFNGAPDIEHEVTIGDERFVEVTLYLVRPMYDAIRSYAHLHGIEPTTAIREAVRAYLGDGQ